MRVLIVEDDTATAKSMEAILKAEGFVCDTTDLGEEGLEIGKLYDYDIIILDLMLPDIDGFEVLRRLRSGRIETPILILSGLSEPDSKIKGFGIGAVQARESFLHRPDLDRQRREEVGEQVGEPRPRPRAGELEAVRHLVDRDQRAELGGVEAPVALEPGEVGDDEQQRRVPGTRHGDVVLTEHALTQEPEDGADLRSEQQR